MNECSWANDAEEGNLPHLQGKSISEHWGMGRIIHAEFSFGKWKDSVWFRAKPDLRQAIPPSATGAAGWDTHSVRTPIGQTLTRRVFSDAPGPERPRWFLGSA